MMTVIEGDMEEREELKEEIEEVEEQEVEVEEIQEAVAAAMIVILEFEEGETIKPMPINTIEMSTKKM